MHEALQSMHLQSEILNPMSCVRLLSFDSSKVFDTVRHTHLTDQFATHSGFINYIMSIVVNRIHVYLIAIQVFEIAMQVFAIAM